jgi:hypothetical protein
MILSDPVGTAINPLKVIDESVHIELSYMDYVVRHPDEIVETLKNPVAGAVGMPAAIAIAERAKRGSETRNEADPARRQGKTAAVL